MKLIAMIPARLGSKRIPKKNIRFMLDKPLIQYPIDLALESGLFGEGVWINTECAELKPVVEQMGARFHERPAELATDTATNRDFTYEFLQKHECDYVVMVNTTSPLLRPDTLAAFVRFVSEDKFDTVMSVVSEQAETFYQNAPLNFSLAEKINSQLLPPTEKIVWALTAWRRSAFMALQKSGANPIYGGRLGRFPIPKDEACDLDTPEDWNIAEGILRSRLTPSEDKFMVL
ncbi:hypothetical protein FACS1894217_06900 [Clostridia bacterium]|nr:hypothetical protein FACS1894217_06900 [Clostridia bacterium]